MQNVSRTAGYRLHISNMSEIDIRLCNTWDECVQCEELQKRVWEMPDYRDAVPANLLITAIKNGGLLVGAFDGEAMVGFAFGFMGRDKANALKHTSHMLGVLPEVRVKGLGAQMKWLQCAEARKQGLDLMTWTYDPLQAINAHLNLVRLGAITRRYYRDTYGAMTDALNVGVASDRFEVEWHMNSERVQASAANRRQEHGAAQAQALYEIRRTSDDLIKIEDETMPQDDTVLVEIPSDYNAIKAANRPLAVEWRERTRSTFERLLARGYTATDFRRSEDAQGRARAAYVLVKHFELR